VYSSDELLVALSYLVTKALVVINGILLYFNKNIAL